MNIFPIRAKKNQRPILQAFAGILFGCLLTGPAGAQVIGLSLSPGIALPGTAVTVDLSMTASGGAQPTALQWTLGYPANVITHATLAAGPSVNGAGKNIVCASGTGSITCLAYGFNVTPIGAGPVASVTLSIAPGAALGSVPVELSGAVAADSAGSSIPASGAAGTITVSDSLPVSLSGLSCSSANVTAPGSGNCTMKLTGPAPPGGFSVNLSSGNANASVPASVTVPAGNSTTAFQVVAGAISVNQSALLTASANGVTQTFTLNLLTQSSSSLQLSAVSCASSTLTAGQSTVCTVMLSNVTASPVSVSLTSTSSALSAPPSVVISTGSNSGSFTASAGSVSVIDTAVVIAIWNAQTRFAVVTVNPGEPPPSDGGLIGHWKFDEGSGTTAADASGNNYNGVVSGASWTAGKVNSALRFTGTGTSVVTPAISLGATFSVSAWVNPAATQGGYVRIAETRYNGGFYLGTNLSGTRYKFIVNSGFGASGTCGAGYGCAEGGTITAGWHLVTATYDGSVGRLYVDGALVGIETFTAPPATNYPLYIGRLYDMNGYGWNGAVDEVRLYNKALSSAEIAELYVPPSGSGQSLTGHWKFDEGSGTTAADASGNNYNGVVNGASWTAGKVNSALSFNGTSTSVVTPAISLGTTFSVSVWVNPAATAQGGFVRIAETRYDGGLYVGTNATGTRYKFIVNSGLGASGTCGAAYGCAEGGTITAGWHLVTATYDGTVGRLYVDGALVASETFTKPPAANYPLYIGRFYGASGYGWRGAVDELRLYNKALTAAEVTALFTSPGAP